MTAAQCRTEIGNLVQLLAERGIAIAVNVPVLRYESGLTVVGSSRTSGTANAASFATIDDYLGALRRRDFGCVLLDGALLQFLYVFRGAALTKHRLAYYPCPVRIPTDEVASGFALDELVELYLEAEWREAIRLRPPLRFDFDPAAVSPGHPASHLHIGHDDCRVPVFGALSIGHFVRLVFRHFYPEVWVANAELREWALQFGTRSVEAGEERELFLDCRAEP